MNIYRHFTIWLLICLIPVLLPACSLRYEDPGGHDTVIGFPTSLNHTQTAEGSDETITWRRLKRTGIGVNICSGAVGFMIGSEDVFLLWVHGDGWWELSNSSEAGMRIIRKDIPAVSDDTAP